MIFAKLKAGFNRLNARMEAVGRLWIEEKAGFSRERKYVILEFRNATELTAAVTSHFKQGWDLVGGLHVVTYLDEGRTIEWYYQAMIWDSELQISRE